jgi:hypothetical protein
MVGSSIGVYWQWWGVFTIQCGVLIEKREFVIVGVGGWTGFHAEHGGSIGDVFE